MLLFVTYPLILGVSGWAFYAAILPNKKPWFIVVGWLAITFGLIFALAFTGCRDPGILYRHSQPPPQHENSWRWSEQAQSYRPRNAHYDLDTAVVVQVKTQNVFLSRPWIDLLQKQCLTLFFLIRCLRKSQAFDHTCPWTVRKSCRTCAVSYLFSLVLSCPSDHVIVR
jgi:hypothetical protein